MKSFRIKISCLALAHGLPVLVGGASSDKSERIEIVPGDLNFLHIVPVETWLAGGGFRSGDNIEITLVRGDRPRLEPGGTYVVEGRYMLASERQATIALSLTTSAPGSSAWSKSQFATVDKGRGTFLFTAEMKSSGQFHVSFYFSDPEQPGRKSSQGGVYFDNR